MAPSLARRVSPWIVLTTSIVAWLALDRGFSLAREEILSHLRISGIRQVVAVQVLVNTGHLWVMFAGSVFLLRLRGQTLADIGWGRPASKRGWVSAAALAIIYSGVILATLGNSAQLLSDWSFYRISLALLIGISAGVCQETLFRGFVMTQARDAGVPVAAQILLSAVLFGLALTRFGWAGMPAAVDFWAVTAIVALSAFLGAVLALIYVVSRRSLTPVIVAHAIIDMSLQPGMLLFAATGKFIR